MSMSRKHGIEETEKMGEQYENFYLVFFNLLTPPSYMLQAAEIM